MKPPESFLETIERAGCHRRAFIARSTLALLSARLPGAPVSRALPVRSRRPVREAFPDAVSPDVLRAMALTAIDAARQAGADYADVRVATSRNFMVFIGPKLQYADGTLTFDTAYGIRVRVNGIWTFVTGVNPTVDKVTGAAQKAVATARGLAGIVSSREEFLSTPVASGEWRAPIAIDPFAVSPDEHVALLGAYQSIGERLPNAAVYQAFDWGAESRVVATSDGSLVTQHFATARPYVGVRVGTTFDNVELPYPDFGVECVGFERVSGPVIQESIRAFLDTVNHLYRLPTAPAVALGRYDVAFDGRFLGAILGKTVVPALELDRALGHEADGAGTSFLAPADGVLGRPVFASTLTLTAERKMPYAGAAQWDDEGVETRTFPLVEQGVVVNYCGTRRTVPALQEWYRSHQRPVSANGSAVAGSVQREPTGTPTAVVVAPAAGNNSFDELVKTIGNGVVAKGAGMITVNADQQLSSVLVKPGLLLEVKNGVITRRLSGGMMQFDTRRFWRSLARVGDASTLMTSERYSAGGAPWAAMQTAIHAPAAVVTQVDITPVPRDGR